jgi:DNA polymerase-3 subunit delta
MCLLSPQQALYLLKKKEYSPLYFVQGDEHYYIDMLLSYFKDHILEASEKTFNLTVLYGIEHKLADIIRRAQQYPIVGEKQVLIIKEAQELTEITRDTGLSMLKDYLKKPNPTMLIVFFYEHKTLPANSKLSKVLQEAAVIVQSKKMYDNQLPAWVRNYVAEKQLTIKDEAVLLLQELIGNDLSRIAKEIDKIVLNMANEGVITVDLVQNYVGMHRQFNVFELQNAIVTKNLLEANRIVLQLLENTTSSIANVVISLLATFFSKLLLIHQTSDRSASNLVTALKLHAYFIPQYIAAAKLYPVPKIIQNISDLQEADMKLKGITSPFAKERAVLQELVYKLLH